MLSAKSIEKIKQQHQLLCDTVIKKRGFRNLRDPSTIRPETLHASYQGQGRSMTTKKADQSQFQMDKQGAVSLRPDNFQR